MATSPTTISFTNEKWVTAITDLMQLTQKHQLLWREDAAPREPLLGPCYMAEFNGNTLILQRKPLEKQETLGGWARFFTGSIGSAYVLRVFKPDGELLMMFPSVAALDGLKIAIDAQLYKEDDSFLQAIHQATVTVAQ